MRTYWSSRIVFLSFILFDVIAVQSIMKLVLFHLVAYLALGVIPDGAEFEGQECSVSSVCSPISLLFGLNSINLHGFFLRRVWIHKRIGAKLTYLWTVWTDFPYLETILRKTPVFELPPPKKTVSNEQKKKIWTCSLDNFGFFCFFVSLARFCLKLR